MLSLTFVPFLFVREQSRCQSWQTARTLREVKESPNEGALWRLMETASVPPVSTDPSPTSALISLTFVFSPPIHEDSLIRFCRMEDSFVS